MYLDLQSYKLDKTFEKDNSSEMEENSFEKISNNKKEHLNETFETNLSLQSEVNTAIVASPKHTNETFKMDSSKLAKSNLFDQITQNLDSQWSKLNEKSICVDGNNLTAQTTPKQNSPIYKMQAIVLSGGDTPNQLQQPKLLSKEGISLCKEFYVQRIDLTFSFSS